MSLVEQSRLNDLCIRVLVRCFRRQVGALSVESPRLLPEDVQALRLYWALSGWVTQLARQVVAHPRYIREILDEEDVITAGVIPSTIDARATLLEQERSQDPTVYIGSDHTSTNVSGPNHVIAWTLNEALSAVSWAVRHGKLNDSFQWLMDQAHLLEAALRVYSLRDVMLSPLGRQRPSAAALRAVSKSRAPLYRLGLEAFLALDDIEALRTEALAELFSQTLVPMLEDWQRFELATAISVSTALAEESGCPVELDLAFTHDKPLTRIGPFSVWWQFSQRPREEHLLDDSEQLVRTLAQSFGITQVAGRADIAIRQDGLPHPIAFLECKWFQSVEALPGAILDASSQLVRYARDAYPDLLPAVERLLAVSVEVVASLGTLQERLDCAGPINLTDFNGLARGALRTWAIYLLDSVDAAYG